MLGHVPLNWSKMASKFLQIKNHHIHVEMTGKRVNRESNFYGDARVITWVKNSLKKLDNGFMLR